MTKNIVSILLVLALAVCLFAGSALAAVGDFSGDSFLWYSISRQSGALLPLHEREFSYLSAVFNGDGSVYGYNLLALCVLPVSVLSGSYSNFYPFPQFKGAPGFLQFYDVLGNFISLSHDFSGDIPEGTRFISVYLSLGDLPFSQVDDGVLFAPSQVSFSSLLFDSSSGSGSGSGGSDVDPAILQNILDGVEAIARSFLDLETGPYSSTSGVTLNSDGVVTPTTRNDATLETLLNLIGVSSTYSSLAIEQMNLNFGNYFEYHEIEDTSSGTVTVVKNLPSYVNALGMELTDGINKLQRDNLMIYQQGEDLKDALYTDKTENQPWSVAQWLKDIYTAITSFFSSFWSPAETALKTAAEDGMQAAADNGNAASGSQVDEVNSAADAFKSFGSTGNIGSGDVMDIFSDGASYDFFSQTTKDNLAYHPPAGSQRMLRSSSSPVESDQSEEEYVDELDAKLSYLREVLGLP